MSFKVPFKIKVEVTPEFEKTYKKAIKKTAEYVKDAIKNEIPNKTGITANTIMTDIDMNKGEATIGWRQNSQEELVANVLQFGSGERGEQGYRTSHFGEQKPQYTNPIVPTRTKAMHFIGDDGKSHFMKSFKGHHPKYVITKALDKTYRFLPIVFIKEMNK